MKRAIFLFSLFLFLCTARPAHSEGKKLEDILKATPEQNARDKAAQEAEAAWTKRVFVEPFRARLKGETWNAMATSFVERAVVRWNDPFRMGATDVYRGFADFSDEAEALLKAGCNDPLVIYLAAFSVYGGASGTAKAQAVLDRAKPALEDPSVSNALKRFIVRLASVLKARGEHKFFYQDAEKDASLTKAAWKDEKCYGPEEASIFLKHETGNWVGMITMGPEQFGKAYKDLGLPDWAQLTLDGIIEISRGQKLHGGGYSKIGTGNNPEDVQHFKAGRDLLVKAWNLKKTEPWAALEMIPVAMVGTAPEGETALLWFERTLAARFDLREAYKRLLLSTQAQWGGGEEQTLAAGRAFLATGRFDTAAPLMYRQALILPGNADNSPDRFADPRIAKELTRLYEGLRDEPTRRSEKQHWSQWLAIYSWMAHDLDKAGKAYAASGGRLNGLVRYALKQAKLDAESVEAELIAAAAKQLKR